MSDPIQDIARQLCIHTPTGDGVLAKIRQTIDLLRDAASERDALAAELADSKHRNGVFGLELTNEVERRLQAERRLHEVADHCATVERELAALKAVAGEPVGHFSGEFGGDVDKRLWFRVVAVGALPAAGAYLYTRPPIAPDSCSPSTCENAQVGMLGKAPEVEAVEVVAWIEGAGRYKGQVFGTEVHGSIPIMTVAQHNRIIAQLTDTK